MCTYGEKTERITTVTKDDCNNDENNNNDEIISMIIIINMESHCKLLNYRSILIRFSEI